MAKNHIIDEFMIEAKSIENKYVAEPRKTHVATLEAGERAAAEDMLKKIK